MADSPTLKAAFDAAMNQLKRKDEYIKSLEARLSITPDVIYHLRVAHHCTRMVLSSGHKKKNKTYIEVHRLNDISDTLEWLAEFIAKQPISMELTEEQEEREYFRQIMARDD